jgi:nitronate monooxygenase
VLASFWAPMAGVQGSRLGIAVSNAGGLGPLPGAMLTTDGLRKELGAAELTRDLASLA